MTHKSRPEISPHLSSCSHLIEGLLELAMPENNLPRDEEAIGTGDILNACSARISKITEFEGYAFFLVDENLDFNLHTFSPNKNNNIFQQLVDQWIDDGIFSWALNQNRAVLLSEDGVNKYILHVLTTRTKIFGMYVGLIGDDSMLDEGVLALLSVILMNCATTFETHELHLELKRYAKSLESKITERTRQLEIAKNRAEDAVKQKSAFLATMSHEIRTPMNGVIGMAQMLQKTQLDNDQQEYMRIITQSGQSLVLLINDILDFSKIEAGKLRLEPQPTDLIQICLDVITLLKPQADEKQLAVTFSHTSNNTLKIVGDSGRLRQILINLLGNAIKFTTQGNVGIEIETAEESGNNIKIALAIKDTGIGIKPEDQEQLFKPFNQARNNQEQELEQKGTGLGLAICKQLIEMMGGEVGITSEPGKGSTFWINLTLEKASETSQIDNNKGITNKQENNADLSHFQGKILVAEDNIVNQKVIRLMLQSMGLRSKIVKNGQKAFEILQDSKFDLVFMDCQMPVLNGYDATQQIRNISGPNQRIPIIALSANALDEDKKHCLDVGMDDFISKPIDQEKLVMTLAKWLHIDIKYDIPETPKEIEIPPNDSLIDHQRLNYLKSLSEEQCKVLVDLFLDHTAERIKNLRLAVEALDHEDSHRIAHTIKGSSATFGAQKLYELAIDIDALAQAGEIASINQLLDNFEECFYKSQTEILAFIAE